MVATPIKILHDAHGGVELRNVYRKKQQEKLFVFIVDKVNPLFIHLTDQA